MAFFDELGKKLSQTSQDVAKKTRNFADTAKFNSMISDEEKNIQDLYRKIGKLYYDLHKDAPEDQLSELVSAIVDAEANIQHYNDQIAQINGVAKCPACGAEVPEESLFCKSCGAKMPQKPVAQPVDTVKCPGCGQEVPEGQKFCIHCGATMPQAAPTSKACPTCGKELPPEAAFCTGCGTKM